MSKIEVGQTYTLKDGQRMTCVFANSAHAWLSADTQGEYGDPHDAYVWSHDGKAVSLKSSAEKYDLVMPAPVSRRMWFVLIEGMATPFDDEDSARSAVTTFGGELFAGEAVE